MTRKKILAYAKDANDTFILDNHGRLRRYFIWDALRLQRTDSGTFKTLSFYSVHSDESRRIPVVPVEKGFYLSRESHAEKTKILSDESRLSHAVAIQALAEQRKIDFLLDGKVVPFFFKYLIPEERQFCFGGKRIYTPDLVGHFQSENPFYSRWHGEVAIELRIDDASGHMQAKEFEEHGVAIIEITLGDDLLFDEGDGERYIFYESELHNYFQKLREVFSRPIAARILSNPISVGYHENSVAYHEKQVAQLRRDIVGSIDQYKKLQTEMNVLRRKSDEVEEAYRVLRKEMLEQSERLASSLPPLLAAETPGYRAELPVVDGADLKVAEPIPVVTGESGERLDAEPAAEPLFDDRSKAAAVPDAYPVEEGVAEAEVAVDPETEASAEVALDAYPELDVAAAAEVAAGLETDESIFDAPLEEAVESAFVEGSTEVAAEAASADRSEEEPPPVPPKRFMSKLTSFFRSK